ncbi:type 4b pilus protein PilO2 [Paraburkholderia youngii]|uniref:type 4b pilus protein PilO2 n=1 Tax=Paraburkholderia youngii TaxID=2782701 RepID=UPI003D1C0A78
MAQLIEIPGLKGQFAVGLDWRVEETAPGSAKLRATSFERGRWGIVRKTDAGAVQVGNCSPIGSLKNPSRVRALAAIVAEHRPEPWLGLYKLPDKRYWLVAVRDRGAVIPNGDRIGTMEEIQEVLNHHRSIGDWEEIFPQVEDLADVIRSTSKQLTLSDFQRRAWVPVAAVAGGLSLLAIAGASVWAYQRHVDEEAQQQQAVRAAAIRAAAQARNDAEAKILPWTRLPMPTAALSACGNAWDHQALAKAGWTLSAWHCDVSPQAITVRTDWKDAGGLARNAPGVLASDAKTSTDSNSVPITYSPPSASALPDVQAIRAIWTLAQTNGLDLTFAAVPAVAALPGTQPAANPTPWVTAPATFATAAPPWTNDLPSAFDSMPGLRVSNVDWVSTGGWTTATTLYSMRETPAEAARASTPKKIEHAHTRERA